METSLTNDKKIISIHQPNYIPWLGYFYKIYQSDIFVFLDDAQYSNKGMHNYHYIKTPQGLFRLKFPVNQKFGDMIFDVTSKDTIGWKEKHIKTIENNYRKARFFEEVIQDYSYLLNKNYTNIAVMNASIIKFITKKLGIKTKFVFSSDIKINSIRQEKILDLCNYFDVDVYYSGTGAKAYQDERDFSKRNIELKYSVYRPFEYTQFFGDFQSNVTIIDYLMHYGYDWDRVLSNQHN